MASLGKYIKQSQGYALQAEVEKIPDLPPDVDDILHYIRAMNSGLKRLQDIPLSTRLIKEVHAVLMTSARSTQEARPGEFRQDQNWVDGTSPFDARFVPPPAHLVADFMGDLEAFLHKRGEVLSSTRFCISLNFSRDIERHILIDLRIIARVKLRHG